MNNKKKLCLVCSSGGHFYHLYYLKGFWSNFEHFWVTFPGLDTECLLKNEKVKFAFYPTNRNIKNLIKNFFLAKKIIKEENPDVIVSTGAGVAVPFLIVGKLYGKRVIYIECLTRIHTLSLTGKLVYFICDHFLVSWPELAKKYKKCKYAGGII